MKKFHVQDEIWSEKVSIRMKDGNFKADYINLSEHLQGTIIDPFMTLSRSEAQELANQLYAAGIQPEQGKGSAGQLKAIEYHLEDMRKLVFK